MQEKKFSRDANVNNDPLSRNLASLTRKLFQRSPATYNVDFKPEEVNILQAIFQRLMPVLSSEADDKKDAPTKSAALPEAVIYEKDMATGTSGGPEMKGKSGHSGSDVKSNKTLESRLKKS